MPEVEGVFVVATSSDAQRTMMSVLAANGTSATRVDSVHDLATAKPSVVICIDELLSGIDALRDHLSKRELVAPTWIVATKTPTEAGRATAFAKGAADYVVIDEGAHLSLVVARELARSELSAQGADERRALTKKLDSQILEMDKARTISARTTAMYQQRALQMEVIRQQNEDLDRLAKDLAIAKKVEEDRAREIEASSRLKGEFLANFSHEIRTPLNGILGYCDLLSREEGTRLTPHGRRDLSIIKMNARTLLALINDILDLSKIESGNVDIVKEKVDIVGLIDECAATVRELLKGKSVELTTRVAPTATFVESDSLKLRQIFLNLLSNAAKFTDAGEIVLDVTREGNDAVITVEDTGSGIPADQLPWIFEKFRQVDNSTTRKVGGTGLGLAIVRELARLLGGEIDVWSELGRGSRFMLRFTGLFDESVAGQSAAAPVPVLPESGKHPRYKKTSNVVLIVDDDAPTRHLLRDEFEREGIATLLATDGVEALRILADCHPIAIVLDLHLPRLDGWSVLARIKSDPDVPDIPVILISVEEARARGFALGASEFLVKPFEPERLVTLVNQLVTPLLGEVLVVDDDGPTRELIARNLRRAGFGTAEAKNGQEALLRLRTTKPSLLVLDLVMPGLDGFEVLRTIQAEKMDVQVIVLTGKTLTPDEHATLQTGITVLHKGNDTVEKVITETKRRVKHWQSLASQRVLKVLYVEDSPQNRDLMRRYLRGVYELSEATDGEEALARVDMIKPDIILMDLSLPRIDGFEVTRRLKANPVHARIPVIVVTAHATHEDEARAMKAGAVEYLTKPVARDDLFAAIERHAPKAET